MGKGDKKTKRGKINRNSYGKKRLKNNKVKFVAPEKPVKKEVVEEVPKKAVPKKTVEKKEAPTKIADKKKPVAEKKSIVEKKPAAAKKTVKIAEDKKEA